MSLYLSSPSSHRLRGNMGLGACGHLGGEPPGGLCYSVRVWCWDPEAGSGGALGLSSGALNHPRVRVSIVLECVLLSPKQLHLRERRGARVGSRIVRSWKAG